ncbi:hypothetical protein [Streptomyces griseocarneus]|uniref:hypothetical protein n=1 Tax=Streptomyces griseocarneus TaxID=51201 RepID=UPI00167C550A|nr:hypothetical protein [Streptomyces griseocarneus]MBZ6476413.1 hypothetical protein [Streptomyces griseocarneus]
MATSSWGLSRPLSPDLTRLLADGRYHERVRRIGAVIEQQDGTAGVVRALDHAGSAPAPA